MKLFNGPVVQLVRTPACHAGGREFEPHPDRLKIAFDYSKAYMREWLSGRASPCQGERREFESRLPLQFADVVQW